MSDFAIQAEGLGKKYVIGHQAQNEQYIALRDVLMHNARNLWHKTKDLIQGKPVIPGQELEEVWALKDVDFTIRRGEVVGIIGHNGAGKSTLLKLLSRITEPSSGRATIKGRVASLLEVGTGFHPELTGRENIYLNGAILGMTRHEIKERFDEIVAFAEVEKYLDTPVKRYSSGMYVRLAFAVAAHLEPEILVVDEVLAVGDVTFQEKCLNKMGNIVEGGRTILFVSHNMQAISRLCQRVLLLNQGQVQCDTSADEAISQYVSSVFGSGGGQKGFVSLADYPRQKTTLDRTIQLTHCSMIDENGQIIEKVRAGETMAITVGYKTQSASDYSRIEFEIWIIKKEAKERVIACLSNFVIGTQLNDLSTEGEVKCTINNIPLAPGTYTSRIGCRWAGAWSDVVSGAMDFDVLPGDFYGSGRLPRADDYGGDVYLDYRWTAIEGAEDG